MVDNKNREHLVRLEKEGKEKADILFGGQQILTEQGEGIEKKLDTLVYIVEDHEARLRALEIGNS